MERAGVDFPVVVAGGGPTGLMLAGELKLAGVDVVVLERRVGRELDGSRAGGLHARSLEVLDQRGVVERFLAAGTVRQIVGFAGASLDISDFPTRYNYGLGLWQADFEHILAGWVLEELGVPVRHGTEVTGLAQDGDGVDVELPDGARLRAGYLVGCDGGRSRVRKAAGIGFPGSDPTTGWLIAVTQMREQPPIGVRPEGGGIGPVTGTGGAPPGSRPHASGMGREGGGVVFRVVLPEVPRQDAGEPTLDDLKAALEGAYGRDFGVRGASWISRFSDAARQAESYRKGRVLLAGDAAHIHPPQGGQGLNTGLQDAVNLGWKLARVVSGASEDSLLDSYHAERHPVAARVLRHTRAEVALAAQDERHQAVRDILGELLALDEPRRRIAGMLSGLDIHYDGDGDGDGLAGRRMPDLDLTTATGDTRVYELLQDARPLLLNLAGTGDIDLTPWPDVRRVDARHPGDWHLPVIGRVPQPDAVLVRPDGHIAWAGALTDPDLPQALTRWFG